MRTRTQTRGPRHLHLPQAGAQEGVAGVAVLVGWESLCSRHQANVLPSLGAPGGQGELCVPALPSLAPEPLQGSPSCSPHVPCHP